MTTASTTYLGFPVVVSDHGYVVTVDGTRVAFTSMTRLRSYVKDLRRRDREGATA